MAAQQKKLLQNKLEQIERDKIRMLAEMEAVEEEEQLDDERKVIKNFADLAETENSKEGETRDNDSDIVMGDGDDYDSKEVDDAFIEVDSESGLEGRVNVKIPAVSELILDNENFVDDRWCAVQQKRKAARSRGDIRAAVDKEKGSSRQKTRWFFFLVSVIMIFSRGLVIDYRWVNNQCQIK